MKNAVVGILSILLAAALVFTGVLYSKNSSRQALLAEQESDIARLEKARRQIKSDSEELQKKLDRCERVLGDAQAQPDLEADINQALREKEEAIRTLREKETALHQLEQKLQNMENFIDSLQSKLSNSQSCINTLQTDLLGYKREMADQSIQSSQEKIDRLEAEVVKFQGELLEMLQKTTQPDVIADLKKEISQRQAEIDRLKKDGRPKAPARIQELEGRLAQCQIMIDRLQKEASNVDIAGLKATIESCRTELGQLKEAGTEAELRAVASKIAECRKALDQFKNVGLEKQIIDLEAMINACQGNLLALQGRGDQEKIRQMEVDIMACRTELDSLRGKQPGLPQRELEAELARYREILKASQASGDAKIKALEGRIASYRRELEKAEKEGPATIDHHLINDLKSKIEICRVELDGLQADKSRLNVESCLAEVAELKRSLKSFQEAFPEARMAFLESEIARYQAQLAAAIKGNAGSLVKNLNEKIVVCQTELDALKIRQADVEQYKTRIAALTEKLEAIQKDQPEARAYEAELAALKEKLKAALNDRSEARISFLESEIQRLEDRLKDASAKGADTLIQSLNEEIAGCLSELEGLRLLRHKSSETNALEDRMAEMKRELAMLRETCPPESRITFLESEIDRLKTELGRTRETGPAPLIETLEQKIARCQSQLEDLQTGEKSGGGAGTLNGETKRRTIETLEKELAALKKKKDEVESSIRQLRGARESLSKQLGKQMQDKSVTITSVPKQDNFSVDVVDRVLFDSGRATITAQGREVLTKVGAALKGVQNRRILVVGHTDNVPISDELRLRFDSNWELSAARAVAVTRFFQDQCGLSPDHLEAVAKSFYDPRAANETESGRAQNRRVEIIIGSGLF